MKRLVIIVALLFGVGKVWATEIIDKELEGVTLGESGDTVLANKGFPSQKIKGMGSEPDILVYNYSDYNGTHSLWVWFVNEQVVRIATDSHGAMYLKSLKYGFLTDSIVIYNGITSAKDLVNDLGSPCKISDTSDKKSYFIRIYKYPSFSFQAERGTVSSVSIHSYNDCLEK